MVLAAHELAVQTRKSVEEVTRDSKKVDEGVEQVQEELKKNVELKSRLLKSRRAAACVRAQLRALKKAAW